MRTETSQTRHLFIISSGLFLLLVSPALAGLKAPVSGDQTLTVIVGYNYPAPFRGYCNPPGTPPDHCGAQKYSLDFSPSNPSNTDILSPATAKVWWISGDCLGLKLDGDYNLTICHFSSFNVIRNQQMTQGEKLGNRSGGHIHMNIYKPDSSWGGNLPWPFSGQFKIESYNFWAQGDHIENGHVGVTIDSTQ